VDLVRGRRPARRLRILLDPLSILFVLLITGVGSLIHVYSIGYMAHDERRRRFFAYLNLFIAAMLTLVLADDYLGMFLGWEGVGLASYLLIGFWLHKDSAAIAAKKAFLVNRVGDMGMVLAIALMFTTFHSVSFAASRRASAAPPTPPRPRSACCCCSAPAASPPRSRCRAGCWTRWRAPRRSRR
jgi:NADH-quinone oxidoreductase subunit L